MSYSSVSVDEVAYLNDDQLWSINGFLQSRMRRRSFHMDVAARDGSILRFSSVTSMTLNYLLLLEAACIAAATALLAWILYTKL